MEIIFIIVGLAILGAIAYLIYRLQNLGKQNSADARAFELMQNLMRDTKEANKEALKGIHEVRREMQENLSATNNSLQTQMQRTNRAINERLDNAAKVIGVVSKELGGMQEIGRQIQDFQEFLKSPKLRGNLGEQVMRDLLDQMIPKASYALQYRFKEGQTVDAIIKTKQGIIPLDAKFPLENFRRYARCDEEEKERALHEFRRDVKKHVNDISGKYILPQEGTVDFAVMYVPSETIWYELVRDDADLNGYANKKKVFLVSPNSFYYFLRIVMIGLEGARIEEATREILSTLKGIKQDSEKFGRGLGVLSKHVTNAKNMMDNVNNEYTRLSTKIDRVDLLEAPQNKTQIDSSA